MSYARYFPPQCLISYKAAWHFVSCVSLQSYTCNMSYKFCRPPDSPVPTPALPAQAVNAPVFVPKTPIPPSSSPPPAPSPGAIQYLHSQSSYVLTCRQEYFLKLICLQHVFISSGWTTRWLYTVWPIRLWPLQRWLSYWCYGGTNACCKCLAMRND